MLRRLQEQCWEENNDQLYGAVERRGTECAPAWANLTKSPMKMKPQGHTPHSTTKKRHLRNTGLGHESIPSKQSPLCGPLLKKRYRLGSVPAAASIGCDSDTNKRRPTAPHSSSPFSSQKGFRKHRKRHPMDISTATYYSSQGSPSYRRLNLGGFRPSQVVNGGSSECSASLSNYTLPRMGQRSVKTEQQEEVCSRGKKKPSMRNHSLSTSEKPINSRPQNRSVSRSDGVRLHNHKKSASVGAVGVARLWGCVGVKGWRGGECCCEDVGEELGKSVIGDTISIEGTVHVHVHLYMCIHGEIRI
jgi:hypothetical protein